MATNESTRTVALRVPMALFEAVDGMASDRGVTKSALMRDLLEREAYAWQLERQAEELVQVASLEEIDTFLTARIARERELRDRVDETVAGLEQWLHYVREQRDQATAQVKARVAGGLRAGIGQRQMQLEKQ